MIASGGSWYLLKLSQHSRGSFRLLVDSSTRSLKKKRKKLNISTHPCVESPSPPRSLSQSSGIHLRSIPDPPEKLQQHQPGTTARFGTRDPAQSCGSSCRSCRDAPGTCTPPAGSCTPAPAATVTTKPLLSLAFFNSCSIKPRRSKILYICWETRAEFPKNPCVVSLQHYSCFLIPYPQNTYFTKPHLGDFLQNFTT